MCSPSPTFHHTCGSPRPQDAEPPPHPLACLSQGPRGLTSRSPTCLILLETGDNITYLTVLPSPEGHDSHSTLASLGLELESTHVQQSKPGPSLLQGTPRARGCWPLEKEAMLHLYKALLSFIEEQFPNLGIRIPLSSNHHGSRALVTPRGQHWCLSVSLRHFSELRKR